MCWAPVGSDPGPGCGGLLLESSPGRILESVEDLCQTQPCPRRVGMRLPTHCRPSSSHSLYCSTMGKPASSGEDGL